MIPRIRPNVTFYGFAITRQFESMGIRVLNAAEQIKRSRDKLLASQLFTRHELSMPVTGFAVALKDRFWDEFINTELYAPAPDARLLADRCRREYNTLKS